MKKSNKSGGIMKIYFRENSYTDYSRVGYDNIVFEYQFTPYDQTERPISGYYAYSEYELPSGYEVDDLYNIASQMILLAYDEMISLDEAFLKVMKNKK